ncbi:hypothetical protein QMM61_15440 [Leptospira santarosai]|uniref:hypothetical protein n=1 Tax=Leptospira santarosai TaxID=28183 RepID=UPI0024AFE9BD|nr:hypothetical protein [Leptospira santarosai]MDI7198081.1 hypothetical protein [Leptospira santarosai]
MIVLTFEIVLPVLYFLFGKKFAVSKALQFLVVDDLKTYSSSFSEKLELSIRKKTETELKERMFLFPDKFKTSPTIPANRRTFLLRFVFFIKRLTGK